MCLCFLFLSLSDHFFPRKFFSGGGSTLRTHISRYISLKRHHRFHIHLSTFRFEDHFEFYQKKCEEENIKINPRCIPKGKDDPLLQTTLDKSVVPQPRIPQFTSSGLLDYLVELVVSEDDVCSLLKFECSSNDSNY